MLYMCRKNKLSKVEEMLVTRILCFSHVLLLFFRNVVWTQNFLQKGWNGIFQSEKQSLNMESITNVVTGQFKS